MLIRFVKHPGAKSISADLPECPRLEEFVDFGDGLNWWVNSVRWPLDTQKPPTVEVHKGHPPRLFR